MDIYARFGHLVGRECLDLGAAAERLGFDGIVLSDHLFFPAGSHSPYPYSSDGEYPFLADTPWPDPLVTFAALAAVTTRLHFVTAVYLLALRHPLEVAKSLATAAAFADGRIRLGVGVGWMREEYDVLGIDYATRGARTDEAIDVLRALWADDTASYDGRFFRFPSIRSEPRLADPPRILIGGPSEVAVRRAITRGDGYVGISIGLDEAPELVRDLRRRVADAGRDPSTFEICMTSTEASTAADLASFDRAGIDTLYLIPWADPATTKSSYADKLAGLERLAAVLGEYRDGEE